jgi:hypothetical protein
VALLDSNCPRVVSKMLLSLLLCWLLTISKSSAKIGSPFLLGKNTNMMCIYIFRYYYWIVCICIYIYAIYIYMYYIYIRSPFLCLGDLEPKRFTMIQWSSSPSPAGGGAGGAVWTLGAPGPARIRQKQWVSTLYTRMCIYIYMLCYIRLCYVISYYIILYYIILFLYYII